MREIPRLVSFVLACAAAGVADAATMELEWTFSDGRVERETRPLAETGDVSVFYMPRAEIAAKGAKELSLTPDFARARKGDDGFWVFSSGECGTFRCDEGKAQCDRWQLMSVYGMKTPERTFAAIVRKLKYYFTTRVTAKGGEYRMSCVLGEELCRDPYEDFEIEFRRLDGVEATMGGIARAYRRYQLERGAVKPLEERAAANVVLKEAISAPEIRMRQAWKPVPPRVLEQTPEAEPPVTPHVTFDRVVDIARDLKRAGVEKAELCLVGWNIGGHDGRWPQAFPPEPTLGGDEGLRRCVKAVRDMGYLIVPHGNYLDAYRIADSWDEEWLAKTVDGGLPKGSGSWGGGKSMRICPKRAYERFCSRDMWRMGAYGFKGLGYFDVVSIVHADECHDPRHPVNRAEAAKWWGKGAMLSRKVFGGFASEGAFDHFASELDYALYVSFKDPRQNNQGLVDRIAPFPQLTYNGVFAMNPFTKTINFTAQERYWQLKLIEFSGRPSFYFYSKFKDDGKNWMGDGDLGCATDAELAAAVEKIKEGSDIYAKLSRLQFKYMEEHDSPAEGVWRTTYSDGTRVYVNYGSKAVAVDGVTVPPEGWTCAGAERTEAWSSDWMEVTAANGVKDDYYPLQTEKEKCSFKFRVMRNSDNTIGVEAFVRDDKVVVDDSPAGSISCPTWKDDCLEVFFDGDNDRNPNTRGPEWNDNPTPCNAGGEYAIAANGATQSDYASAKKCFGRLWGGIAEPWAEDGVRIGTHYRLWFTWDCLARPAPRPDEDVTLRMTVCIHDDDDGGACDYALYWKGNPKYPFADESAFGEVILGNIKVPQDRKVTE